MATIEIRSDIVRRSVHANVKGAPDLTADQGRYVLTIRPHSIIVRFESGEVVTVTVIGPRALKAGGLGVSVPIEYGIGGWQRHKLADAPDWVHEAVRSLPAAAE